MYFCFSIFSGDSLPDDTTGEARMYEQPGEMCPVGCYKLYVSKLHPDLQDLWQKPRESFGSADSVWYCKTPLGKNTLYNMMSTISTRAKLSKRYTNHCVRATSISALDRAGFEGRHIIRATGHKSEMSIKSYSSRLTEGTKRQMSDALSNVLKGVEPASSKPAETFPEITTEELNQLFSAENDFSEIELPQHTSSASSVVSVSSAVTTNYAIDHQMKVANIVPGSPQIVNFPGNSTSRHYNVAPTMNNCVVNFHFHGK